MARTRRKVKPLPTLGEVPDAFWGRVLPILLAFWPAKPTGRKVADWRLALDGILFRLRSGCQWDQLPRRFGPTSTVHGWFQRWCRGGVMEQVWAALVEECDELGAVHWQWRSADGARHKARFGGEKGRPQPHRPRQERRQAPPAGGGGRRAAGGGRGGGQRQRPQAAGGHPRGGRGRAPRADAGGAAAPVPGQGVRQRPEPGGGGRARVHAHIRPLKGERGPRRRRAGAKPRRWVVERTLAWLSECRALLARYDKHAHNYLGLIQLACSLLWYRRLHRLAAA